MTINVKLNRKLNIVLEIETSRGRGHVHSVPIARIVFEDNFKVLSRTFAAFYQNYGGLGPYAGPRVAKLLLMEQAEALDETDKIKQTLIPEIERLTNVFIPGERGWESIPYQVARNRNLIDEQTAAEVENALVYFTCATWMNLQMEMQVAFHGLIQGWRAVSTSSNATEYMNSLPTLTPAETTGEKPTSTTAAAPSSIPT